MDFIIIDNSYIIIVLILRLISYYIFINLILVNIIFLSKILEFKYFLNIWCYLLTSKFQEIILHFYVNKSYKFLLIILNVTEFLRPLSILF